MKKLLIALAFAGFSLSSQAQETADPTLKYSVATNSFWSNWFVQGNFTWTAFYSNEEKGMGWTKNPFKDFRRDMGFSVAVGKWFTPGIGLRTKFNGVWGKDVPKENAENTCKHNHYWNIQEQALLNLSNLFFGYNPTRVWNLSPFAGVGVVRNMSLNTYELAASAGLLSQWRLTNRLQLNLELQYNIMGDDFEGVDEPTPLGGHKNKNHDQIVSAEIGLTYNLGHNTWNKVPDVDAIKALSQSQIDALNAQLNDANAENARLKNLLANQKPVESKAVKEFVNTPVSVFFNINKTNIASQKDLVNIEGLAKYAKANGAKLKVDGYADSATGNEEINQKLSEGRANAVADELVKMGVDRSKITTQGHGGVDELSPVSFNRRATVQVTD
jgi:OmpA-OmpF porin, OOP family